MATGERQEGTGMPIIDDIQPITLTKARLTEILFEQIGLNKREARDMIEAFFGTIAETLVQGEEVKLPGFGNFEVKMKAARPGRNPRTGEEVLIAARRVVTFRASRKLRDRLDEAAAD